MRTRSKYVSTLESRVLCNHNKSDQLERSYMGWNQKGLCDHQPIATMIAEKATALGKAGLKPITIQHVLTLNWN